MVADLTPEYIAPLRRMTGTADSSLYDPAKRIKAARILQQHPDWTEGQVRQRVNEIFLHAVT